MEIYKYNEAKEKVKNITNRTFETNEEITVKVKKIIEDVKKFGDNALIDYTKKFDNYDIKESELTVGKDYLEQCYRQVDKEILNILTEAAENIRKYHQYQKEKTWIKEFDDGVKLGQKITPLERVGVYVPGGKAFYPSSCLMNVIPAQVAGVKEIIPITPPKSFFENPLIGATLYILGLEKVCLAGGAQAVAALAFGTKSIPKVDKIVGPGNAYVAEAKRQVFGYVDIDMIAGPSEIVVLSDGNVPSSWIALDLLSQSEHRSGYESSILVTTNYEFAKEVKEYINKFLEEVEYKDVVKSILEKYGAIIVVDNLEEGIDLVNSLAPEHLELAVSNPYEILEKIKNAGAIFLGKYSSEPVGDYWAGPNHVLPTNGTSRFFSPLGVYDFIKRSSIIDYSKEAIIKNGEKIYKLALEENLYFHGKAVLKRKIDLEDDQV